MLPSELIYGVPLRSLHSLTLQPGWRPPFGRVIADGVASADDAGRAGAWAAGERADRGAVAR